MEGSRPLLESSLPGHFMKGQAARAPSMNVNNPRAPSPCVGRPDLADFAFAALVIVISFSPLLPVPGWQGYGPHGEFSCNCGQYFVRYSDPTYGGDRPHVFTVYQGFQVDVAAASDSGSTVDGLDLYSNFTTAPAISGGTLSVLYSSPGLNFTKRMSYSDGAVDVYYAFPRNVTAVLTFWRWYYSTVGPYDRPTTRQLPAAQNVTFSFFSQGALFNASIASDPAPAAATISGVQGAGLNKITLEFQASSVNISIRVDGVKPLAGAGVLQVASSDWAFPVIGIVVAGAYLGARKWVVAA